jgi:hypothetical protein
VVGRDSYSPKRKKQYSSPPRKSKGSKPRRSDAPLSRDASNIVCFNCDKKGYYTNKCRSPKKGSAPSAPAQWTAYIATVKAEEKPSNKPLKKGKGRGKAYPST